MIDNACEWGEAALLIFSENVGALIYYTHIFPLIISLFLGFQVLINNPKQLSNRVLFVLSILFSIWVYFDLILWASPTPEFVMFFWSAIVPIELLMYLCSLYLVYIFTHNKEDAPLYLKVLFSLLLLPILLFGHTSLNVIGLSPDCDTGAFEGILIQYMYAAEIFIIFVAAYFTFNHARKLGTIALRKSGILVGVATIIFLSFFTAGNLTLSFSLGPYYEQYKLFGMPLFAAIVAYTIVKHGAFQIKAVLAEILISVLWILMFSMLLFRDMTNARPIIIITVVIFGFIGILLSKSIRKEIEQKEEISKLALTLEKANNRLKELDKQKSEFVSIASHQLRSPLTAIRGYVSMMREGSFGPISEKISEPLNRIEQSAKFMAVSIDDFLNVSRIESGNMKYDLKDINLPEQTSSVVEDLRSDAIKRGLLLLYRNNVQGRGIVTADFGKTQQILHNLINNALKYTPKGTVTVYVHDDPATKRIHVEIIDTGIGMSEASMYKLFEKFSRAKIASSANIMGTGLGLFVAREMARAMKGDIIAHSDGEGKGSRFVFTMPYQM